MKFNLDYRLTYVQKRTLCMTQLFRFHVCDLFVACSQHLGDIYMMILRIDKLLLSVIQCYKKIECRFGTCFDTIRAVIKSHEVRYNA